MPLEKNLKGDEKWVFDAPVAEHFDDMLERSIPEYGQMRDSVHRVGDRLVAAYPDHDVVDLGCSRGGALARFVDDATREGNGFGQRTARRFVGLETSEPMVAAAKARFAGNARVEIRNHDLRNGLPKLEFKASLVLCVLTLQFTPIEHRQRILREAYEKVTPGGGLILVEKVLGNGARMDAHLVDAYYGLKRERGYSEEEIQRKRLSLEGVLVPVTARWNEELLKNAGFTEVDCFWRSLSFAGWLALR